MRWLACLLAACSSPGLAARVAADEAVPFREAWDWAVVVPVALGAGGRHDFLLDTGSTSSIVDPELAAELGILPVARTNLVTPAGIRSVGVGRLSLALGSSMLSDVEVLIAALPAIRSDEPRVRGIPGQSALAGLEYTIDHARRRVVVHGGHDAGAAGGDAPARPTLEVRLGCGRSAARLVLDSGVATPVLFDPRGLGLELGAPVLAATNAGDAIWREGRLSSLCVAGRRAGPLSVAVRPGGAAQRTEDGLLPSRFFARVRVEPDFELQRLHQRTAWRRRPSGGRAGTLLAVEHW